MIYGLFGVCSYFFFLYLVYLIGFEDDRNRILFFMVCYFILFSFLYIYSDKELHFETIDNCVE